MSTSIPHIPVLRSGKPYQSLDAVRLRDVRTGAPVADVSQANPGLIARDLADAARRQAALAARPVAELLAVCKRAAQLFDEAELPLGDGAQSPEDYLAQLAATTGMPLSLGRRNMAKLTSVLDDMEAVAGGLTRGLDLAVLDDGHGEQQGRRLSYLLQADSLGAVLPNNSPGVHGLWLPAVPLKVPLALRPGRQEPWTPWRLSQALLAAGCPSEALSLYPSSYDGATQLLLRADRSLLFGDGPTVEPWRADPRVQIHGPGRSKVLLHPDADLDDPAVLDVLVESVASNSGRSCLNASSVRLVRGGRALAERLAERLAAIEPRPLDAPDAELAAFAEPATAKAIAGWLETQLAVPGAEDLTARYRSGERLVELDGCWFVRPTLVWCDSPEHPVADAELLFPFASVVETPAGADEMLAESGSSLVATAIGGDHRWRQRLLACRRIDRLNLGLIPTSRISWDQPHEGNLFAHLYQQRALQAA